ncbi:DNA ligase 1 isoform X2 [Halyomorpha halys]|uniref:DNA ligase 1 isoform X2 n=1 Tax=Halyomorpha halys TaxID=286706 RepID=UPI0034D3374F
MPSARCQIWRRYQSMKSVAAVSTLDLAKEKVHELVVPLDWVESPVQPDADENRETGDNFKLYIPSFVRHMHSLLSRPPELIRKDSLALQQILENMPLSITDRPSYVQNASRYLDMFPRATQQNGEPSKASEMEEGVLAPSEENTDSNIEQETAPPGPAFISDKEMKERAKKRREQYLKAVYPHEKPEQEELSDHEKEEQRKRMKYFNAIFGTGPKSAEESESEFFEEDEAKQKMDRYLNAVFGHGKKSPEPEEQEIGRETKERMELDDVAKEMLDRYLKAIQAQHQARSEGGPNKDLLELEEQAKELKHQFLNSIYADPEMKLEEYEESRKELKSLLIDPGAKRRRSDEEEPAPRVRKAGEPRADPGKKMPEQTPDSGPPEEAQDRNKGEQTPDKKPSEKTPDKKPSEQTTDSIPSEHTPDSVPSEQGPEQPLRDYILKKVEDLENKLKSVDADVSGLKGQQENKKLEKELLEVFERILKADTPSESDISKLERLIDELKVAQGKKATEELH